MSWKTTYEKWINAPQLDCGIKQALKTIRHDENALEECFYKNLEFGTGGMRGEIGPGTNRMNLYTIRKASVLF